MGNNVLQKKKNEKSFEELGGIFSNIEISKLNSIERQAVKIVSKMYAIVRDVSERKEAASRITNKILHRSHRCNSSFCVFV